MKAEHKKKIKLKKKFKKKSSWLKIKKKET
jgi:hypothetical protein